MIKCTRFSKSEIRLLYRSFKQVTAAMFREINNVLSFDLSYLGMPRWQRQ